MKKRVFYSLITASLILTGLASFTIVNTTFESGSVDVKLVNSTDHKVVFCTSTSVSSSCNSVRRAVEPGKSVEYQTSTGRIVKARANGSRDLTLGKVEYEGQVIVAHKGMFER